ncbi:hypothetical protein AcV5_001323 [Taiwanofungus camphoratus]|nr:hypothetical protein AcV5_001323 [Antrodia cinnamomea]
MLGARTKQVFAYGRRGHRIVNVSEDREQPKNVTTIQNEKEKNVPSCTSSPPSSHRRGKSLHFSPISPESSKTTTHAGPARKKLKKSPKVAKSGSPEVVIPVRHPLGLFSPNVPGSPAVPPNVRKKRRPQIGKSTPCAPVSPCVDVDIVVLDVQGRRVSQERRVSRTDVQVNEATRLPTKRKKTTKTSEAPKKEIAIRSDTGKTIQIKAGGTGARPVIISSDESDGDEEVTAKLPALDLSPDVETPPIPLPRFGRRRTNVIVSPESSPSVSLPAKTPFRSALATPASKSKETPFLPPPPTFIRWTHQQAPSHPIPSMPTFPSPVPYLARPRQLTPIRSRSGRASIFPAPPSPPSPTTPTDLSLSLDFSELAISPAAHGPLEGLKPHAPPQPKYLQPLLDECAQSTPHEFSAFIKMFPLDPLVHMHCDGDNDNGTERARFQKIGEASYSEVFGIGDVVLKVIPLHDEDSQRARADDVDGPAPSDARDVLKEIIVTRTMGDICAGFVKLLRTYVVRGKYPSLLLDLWDEYNDKKGSESVRPDTFTVSQVYAIIVLPNGGPDLEAYTFETASKTGWRQACSLFWQVTRTLAEAEDLVCFEHRDLHWGQILVKNVFAPTHAPRRSRAKKVSMDHIAHGVEITVIDLGLARMNSASEDEIQTHWTPFEEEIFEGEGDYQFDVYRMMRTHNGNSWEDYRPLTNVMWLHYLSLKLLHSKRLRPPASSRKSVAPTTSPTFTERECYQCLVETEEMLGRCLAACKSPLVGRKGRRKTQASVKVTGGVSPEPRSAADVLQFAIDRGWVR